MKTVNRRLTALTLFAALCFASAAGGAQRSLTVSVTNANPLRNDKGTFRCALWRSPAGFPDSFRNAASLAQDRPKRRSATCRFTGLKPGRYAVSVLHDENDNQRMDTNLFGIPLEGYGVSNDAPPGAVSGPSWREAVFELGQTDASLGLKIRY